MLVHRRMFAVDPDTGERSVFREVILGCRHRGTAEHWYVSFTPEGRVLHIDCPTIHE